MNRVTKRVMKYEVLCRSGTFRVPSEYLEKVIGSHYAGEKRSWYHVRCVTVMLVLNEAGGRHLTAKLTPVELSDSNLRMSACFRLWHNMPTYINRTWKQHTRRIHKGSLAPRALQVAGLPERQSQSPDSNGCVGQYVSQASRHASKQLGGR